MKVKELIVLLLDAPMESDVCVNAGDGDAEQMEIEEATVVPERYGFAWVALRTSERLEVPGG